MKKLIAALFIGALTLASCASGNASADTGKSTDLYESAITLNDGRTVTCITFWGYNKGGVSCDWDGTK